MEIKLCGKYSNIACIVDADWGQMLIDSGVNLMYRSGYVGIFSGSTNHYSADFVHQLVMDTKTDGKNVVIDHINQNKLDNRRANLRITTKSLNGLNSSKIKSHNKSGVTGVSFCDKRKLWRSYLSINGKRVYDKCFSNREDACLIGEFHSIIKTI